MGSQKIKSMHDLNLLRNPQAKLSVLDDLSITHIVLIWALVKQIPLIRIGATSLDKTLKPIVILLQSKEVLVRFIYEMRSETVIHSFIICMK